MSARRGYGTAIIELNLSTMAMASASPAAYKSLLLPGIIAISMVFTGIWAVAMPLIAEFQWTREIEDRLLAPIGGAWIAIEKVIAGMLQALVAGLIVIPLAWLVLRLGVEISIGAPWILRCGHCTGSHLLRMRRTGFGVQHQSAAYWPDVRHGNYSYDFLRLHLLSMERSENFPYPAESCAHQPAGVCKRRNARNLGSAVPTSVNKSRTHCAAFVRPSAAGCRTAAVREEGGELA